MRGWLRRTLRLGAFFVLTLLMLLVAAYGLLQTSPGLGWTARTLANLASTPGFSVSIKGLGGVIPFDIRAERIEVSDAKGVWLGMDNAQIDLSATALIQIGTLGAAKSLVTRGRRYMAPAASSTLSQSSVSSSILACNAAIRAWPWLFSATAFRTCNSLKRRFISNSSALSMGVSISPPDQSCLT
jgi:autotransporter translocation and assembly factor TamB